MIKRIKDIIFLLKHASSLRGYYNYIKNHLDEYHLEVNRSLVVLENTKEYLREEHKAMKLRITKMEEIVDRKVVQCVPNPYDTYQELPERCSHCELLRRIICIACPTEKEAKND